VNSKACGGTGSAVAFCDANHKPANRGVFLLSVLYPGVGMELRAGALEGICGDIGCWCRSDCWRTHSPLVCWPVALASRSRRSANG
jgi:hypothetical protein